ncbi:MAG: transglutaminase domain-containing protein [Kangiellaceae bacterium]|nr:transglutaminase domain-containing protein [Kangiellaceae bacterium]
MSNTLRRNIKIIALLVFIGLAAFLFWHFKLQQARSAWHIPNLQPFKQWYQINWHGQSVGWASVELSKTDEHFRIKEQDYIEGRVQGERLVFSYQRELLFENKKPYNLLSGNIHSLEPELVVETQFSNSLDENKLQVIDKRNGKQTLRNLEPIIYSLKEYFKLASFIEKQPQQGDSINIRELDNEAFSVHATHYEIEEEPFDYKKYYVVRHHHQQKSEATWHRVTPKGVTIFSMRPSGMEFVASEGKVSLNPEMQQDLYYTSGVTIDKKIGNPRKINKLVLSLEHGDVSWFQRHPDVNVDPDKLIHLNPGSRYPARSKPRLIKASLHPIARSMALAQTQGVSSQWQKTKALVDYVNEYIDYRALPSGFNVAEIIDKKRGDCTEHAKLLVEMLHAIDIPAREVSGLVYLGDKEQRFGGHVWVEVWLDEHWVGVDPTWNLMELTSTHIPLSIGEEGAMAALSSQIEISFKLEDISYK